MNTPVSRLDWYTELDFLQRISTKQNKTKSGKCSLNQHIILLLVSWLLLWLCTQWNPLLWSHNLIFKFINNFFKKKHIQYTHSSIQGDSTKWIEKKWIIFCSFFYKFRISFLNLWIMKIILTSNVFLKCHLEYQSVCVVWISWND